MTPGDKVLVRGTFGGNKPFQLTGEVLSVLPDGRLEVCMFRSGYSNWVVIINPGKEEKE
jgi:translation initiation factor IF-1